MKLEATFRVRLHNGAVEPDYHDIKEIALQRSIGEVCDKLFAGVLIPMHQPPFPNRHSEGTVTIILDVPEVQ